MPTWLPMLIFVPLIGFALYRRFRRTFGRQLLRPRLMTARIVILMLACVLIVATSSPTSVGLAAAGGGIGVGVVLGIVGLRLTTFETTEGQRYYVPNGWIGIAVSALFLGRLAARLFTMPERMAAARAGGPAVDAMQRSPLTLALFCLLAGYYASYYAGVLWRSK